MNNVYIQIGVLLSVAVVYGLELLRRKKAQALNQQGLCARCRADLKLQAPATIQRYRTLQPLFFYCAPCASVLRKHERAFFLSFGLIAIALLASAFYFGRA
jgi:hypothetical protein